MAQSYPTAVRVRLPAPRRNDYRAAGGPVPPSYTKGRYEHGRSPEPARNPWARNPWQEARAKAPQVPRVLRQAVRPFGVYGRIDLAVDAASVLANALRRPASQRSSPNGGWQLQCAGAGHPNELYWLLGYPGIGGPGCGQWLGLDGQGVSRPTEADWVGRTTGVGQSVYSEFAGGRMQVQSYWWRPDGSVPYNPALPMVRWLEEDEPYPWTRTKPEVGPQTLPSVVPLVAPYAPPGLPFDPVPYPMIPALPRIGEQFPELVMREAGNHVPGEEPAPDLVLQEAVATAGGGYFRDDTHVPAVPASNVKERKFIAHRAGVARALWIAARVVTEGIDVAREIHRAIPEKRRTKNARPQVIFRELWDRWEEVNWEEAIRNVIANEMEDIAIGSMSRALNRQTERAFGSRYIGQGLGTKMNKAFGDHEGVPNPFQAAGQWAEDLGLAAGNAAISAQRRYGGQ